MKFLIDFSWFYYECIHLYDKDFYFTYSTDLDIESLQHINRIIFNKFKEICEDFNFFDTLVLQEQKFHPVDQIDKRNKIGLIFKKFGKNEEWIQQNIIDCEYIHQFKIKDNKRRFFFILDRNKNIIKPLIIDLNHVIYENIGRRVEYRNCLICKRKNSECEKKYKKNFLQ